MICATCIHYDPSRLDGYGYCTAAPSLIERAYLLPAGSICRVPGRYHACQEPAA